ncbi:MAG: alpha/beta fold hydrolase [Nocardioides sp.]|uniref:alpha/beta fold hydrolase n=1 Tax=Nocardioides sp. TaxID=35761 RepID=UPI003F074EB3
MTVTETMTDVGGRELFVTSIGEGTPVVMLHGGGPGATGMSNFARNIDPLVAAGHRVIVPDLPGYGRSTKGIDRADPFGDLALAVRGLLDALDLERAHLVGNSYGGAAALRLALDRPDRVDRLVLMGPGGVGTTRAVPTEGLTKLLGYYGGDGPSREKVAEFIRHYLVADGIEVPDEIIDLRYASSIDPEVVADPPLRRPSGPDALKTMLRMDFTRDKRLKRCEVPTLVLWGLDDKVNRPSGGPALGRAMRNCDVYLASGVGHWFQYERPELFASLVTDFLRGSAS